MQLADPVEDGVVFFERAGAEATGDDEDVGALDVAHRRVDAQAEQLVVGTDVTGAGRHEGELGPG